MVFGIGKKKRIIQVNGKELELQPKPSKSLSDIFSFLKRSKEPQTTQTAPQGFSSLKTQGKAPKIQETVQIYRPAAREKPSQSMKQQQQQMKRSRFKLYLERMGYKHKGLEAALIEQGMRESMYEFVKKMLIAAIMLAIVIAASIAFILFRVGLELPTIIIFTALTGVAVYFVMFQTFLEFPKHKGTATSKNIEKDIIFASRDMIISLRSGMPLFNAITSISTGYGDASKEFAKVVERVQLGAALEDAIDQTVATTKSPSFRRIMLQASVSIKAGADVVTALESVIDQLTQERVIELRRYGQKLNALAMFYMLFGIIVPSMGIAVLTILTTFISIFTVTPQVLELVVVMIVFIQVIFLQMIRGSRPVFSK